MNESNNLNNNQIVQPNNLNSESMIQPNNLNNESMTQMNNQSTNQQDNQPKKSNSKNIIIVLIALLIGIGIGVCITTLLNKNNDNNVSNNNLNDTNNIENNTNTDDTGSVLDPYIESKENVFLNNVQNIFRTAQQQYIQDSLSDKVVECYSSDVGHELEIDVKSSLVYFISIIDGNITKLQVADGTYRIDATGTDIKIDQLRNSNATEEENIYKIIKSNDTNIEMCTTSE